VASAQAPDLAVVLFTQFSREFPGRFPSAVTRDGKDHKPVTVIGPVKAGSDIQSIFFDMWRLDHADADLADVSGDLVTSSGSGLDPLITLQNARFQMDRVATKWAAYTKRKPEEVRKEIEQVLTRNAFAPLGGLAGEQVVNVLEVNLQLRKQYGVPL
jgi:K+-transporting ATPase ATPase C chain